MAQRGKMPIKKWDFRGEKWVIGPEKFGVGNQTRRVKWCKMQVLSLKTDKAQVAEKEKQKLFTNFMVYIFARTERKQVQLCKIKDNNLII